MRDFDFKICMFCCPWYLNKPEKVKSQFMNRKKQIAKLRFQSSLKHCLEKNYFFHASNCCWKNNGVCKQEALEFPIHFLCCCVVVQFWKLWKLQKAEFICENWKKPSGSSTKQMKGVPLLDCMSVKFKIQYIGWSWDFLRFDFGLV